MCDFGSWVLIVLIESFKYFKCYNHVIMLMCHRTLTPRATPETNLSLNQFHVCYKDFDIKHNDEGPKLQIFQSKSGNTCNATRLVWNFSCEGYVFATSLVSRWLDLSAKSIPRVLCRLLKLTQWQTNLIITIEKLGNLNDAIET